MLIWQLLSRFAKSSVFVFRPHGLLFIALPITVFTGLTLVVVLFTLGQSELKFDFIGLPIDGRRYQCIAVAFDFSNQLIDLVSMQK